MTTDEGSPRGGGSLAIYADRESRFATIREILACAQATVSADVWNYIEGGTSGEESLRINREAFARWGFRPKMMAGISRPDLAANFLGMPMSMPVFISPFGNDGFIRPEGHLAVADAVAETGITNIVPEGASHSLEDIAACAGGRQGMVQMTLVGPDSHVLGLVERAAAAGYRAVCFTDAPVRAWRERLREARLDLMEQYGMANYGPGKADVDVLRELVAFTEPRWDWDRLTNLARRCPLPWFLKGVLTPEDARLALEAGASGIYVSNYGGRELDGLPATLDQLPAIVDEVAGRVPVILDSGVRRGTDVVKALALGATAVGVGRLAAFGLAADGADGVRRVCQLLSAEMETVIGRLGCDRVSQLGRACVLPALT